MPTIAQAIYAHLHDTAAIAAIVGTRIRPAQGYIADGTPTLVYEIVGDLGYEQSEATSADRECNLTIKGYHANYNSLVTLMGHVRTAMQVKHALLGSLFHSTVFNLGETHTAEFPIQGQNQGPFEFIIDFSVQYATA